MNRLAHLVLPLVAALAASAAFAGVRPSNDRHPRQLGPTVLRAYDLDAYSFEPAKLDAALRELGAEFAYGPRTTAGRPGHVFGVVRAPRALGAEVLQAALRKGSAFAEPLAATAFSGRTGEDHELVHLHATRRDIVVNMSGDARWYDASGTWSQLYGRAGQMDSAYFLDRYEKLNRPYGRARLGEVASESFGWDLERAPGEKLRVKLEKQLAKLRGVQSVGFEGARILVTVVLENLEVCADAGKVPEGEALDEKAKDAPRVAFDSGAVYEVLRKEGLLP